MIRKILKWPEEAASLHGVSAAFDPDKHGMKYLDELVSDLFDTMYDARGVGLSAIQVGVPVRVFVMDVENQDYVFVNPGIATGGKRGPTNEGCLSMPGVYEMVDRWSHVTVVAFDRNYMVRTDKFTGVEAQCVQHEHEHLNGIIMPDKLDATGQIRLASKLKGA